MNDLNTTTKFDLNDANIFLARTPEVLKAFLKDLPSEWIHKNEGINTWSVFDVIGHLIHGEKTDWIPRAKIILSDSDIKEFETFDRFAQFENSKGKTLETLLIEFEDLRKANLEILNSLRISELELDRRGRHPELGIVTLRQLLATWVTHDMTHIGQIARVLAKQYKQEVGPWIQYIGILN